MDVSIIIPTLNRATSLQITLSSIVAQQHASCEYEVIVIDNGSTDHTKTICTEAKNRIVNFTYYYDEEPGMLTGRHKGASLAKGKILSFIDDDVELNPTWVQGVTKAFEKFPHTSIVSGPSLAKYQVYPPAWLKYFWQTVPYGGNMCLPLSLIDLGTEQTEIDPLYAFGLNYSIRKNIFEELRGFHPDRITDSLQKYQGDGETGLSIKAKMKNYSALYISSALLYHLVPKERLQVAYFERWHYYSGICNSFTDIRHQYNLYQSSENYSCKPLTVPAQMFRKVLQVIGRIRKRDNPVPVHIAELRFRFDKKFREGYDFHQQCFLTDEKVKNWVLQPEYLDYKLPS